MNMVRMFNRDTGPGGTTTGESGLDLRVSFRRDTRGAGP